MKHAIKEELNVRKYLVENYLPELSFSDVELNRHRECHRVMGNSQPNFRFHVEIHSLDLKLFEGRDFDFQPSNNALLISQKSREMLKAGHKIEFTEEESKESNINFDEEYVAKVKK